MLVFPNNDWAQILHHTLNKPSIQELFAKVDNAYQTTEVLPHKEDIFDAFKYTSYARTKVVILGQDPYPTPGDAMGLSFSVSKDSKIPRSLKNIFKERKTDLGIELPSNGDLSDWAKQGVLLLNRTLTVEPGQPNKHAKWGWDELTSAAISALNKKTTPVVFLLWGNSAQAYAEMITNPKHKIIMASHPSPLGATKTDKPFIGSKPFSKTNQFLIENEMLPINWNN